MDVTFGLRETGHQGLLETLTGDSCHGTPGMSGGAGSGLRSRGVGLLPTFCRAAVRLWQQQRNCANLMRGRPGWQLASRTCWVCPRLQKGSSRFSLSNFLQVAAAAASSALAAAVAAARSPGNVSKAPRDILHVIVTEWQQDSQSHAPSALDLVFLHF